MHARLKRAAALSVFAVLSACAERGVVEPAAPSFASPRLDAVSGVPPFVVISQVYGAGGNANAVLNSDFIELYNAGPIAVSLAGWSVQYASSTGVFASNLTVALSGSIESGQYYLVAMTVGANGAALPSADATGTVAMAAASGKVALVNQVAALGCNGSPTACTTEQRSHIIDLVGYGSANVFEGTGPAPTLSATLAAFRRDGGRQDTNDNSADFTAATPAPRNKASTTLPPVAALVVTIAPSAPTTTIGAPVAFTVTASKSGTPVSVTTASWSSAIMATATINPVSGVAQALAAGTTTISVDVTTAEGTGSAATLLTVSAPPTGGSVPAIRFSEIHYDNFGNDQDEKIEVEGPAAMDLTGWSVVLYNGNGGVAYSTTSLAGVTRTACAQSARSVVVVSYPANGIQNGSPDGMALVDASGTVIEFLSYEGSFAAVDGPAVGLSSTDIGVAENSSPVGQSLQRSADGTSWSGPATATFGGCNSEPFTPPPGTGSINVSTRSTPLPVGFQTQLFLSGIGTDNQGNPVTNTDVRWSSSNASIVSVDATSGVVTARAMGQATLTATATSDNVTTGSTVITTNVGQLAAAARVGFNTTLGEPTDADPSDDVRIARRQYSLSYNASRGTPNWVSWNLDASHRGSAPRCNCFTADTALTRLGLRAFDTNEWINGGVWSRGHVSPSADWNVADGDNAATFFLSNMIPQNQTANGGAWGDLENYLRSIAVGSTQIYIVSGPIYTRNRAGAGLDGFGFMNSLGRIAVPDSMWKVAIVVPDGRPVTDIRNAADVQVIAANMPNEATATGSWNRFSTTIDAIQQSTGYDLFALIAESVQCRLEVRNCLPEPTMASTSGSNTVARGTPFVVRSSASDADGSAGGPWTFRIDWGDGTTFNAFLTTLPTASRPNTRSKIYSAPGQYTVRLTITDKNGGQGVQTLVVTVTP